MATSEYGAVELAQHRRAACALQQSVRSLERTVHSATH